MTKSCACQTIVSEVMKKFDCYYVEKLSLSLFGEEMFCLIDRKNHMYYPFKLENPKIAESFSELFEGQIEDLPMTIILKEAENYFSL